MAGGGWLGLDVKRGRIDSLSAFPPLAHGVSYGIVSVGTVQRVVPAKRRRGCLDNVKAPPQPESSPYPTPVPVPFPAKVARIKPR